MRQYLHLLGILGTLVGCGAAADEQDPAAGGSGNTPTAGTGSQTPTAGAAGSQSTTGGMSGGGNGNSGGTGNSASGSSSGGSAMAGAPQAGTSAGGSAPLDKPIPDFAFPTPTGSDQELSSTREVSDFDGNLQRFIGTGDLGSGGNAEGQDPLFRISDGGTLRNVIIGAPAADGIHCDGSCTLENVWWEDVGEDAITLEGSSSSNVYRITGGGARHADDKVIQHNGSGTAYIKNFLVDDFGKLYRSCGNCDDQYERHVEFDTVVANGNKGVLAGVNEKYHDSAKFVNIFADIAMTICERYEGNNTGDDTDPLGEGPDATYCLYSPTGDVTWH